MWIVCVLLAEHKLHTLKHIYIHEIRLQADIARRPGSNKLFENSSGSAKPGFLAKAYTDIQMYTYVYVLTLTVIECPAMLIDEAGLILSTLIVIQYFACCCQFLYQVFHYIEYYTIWVNIAYESIDNALYSGADAEYSAGGFYFCWWGLLSNIWWKLAITCQYKDKITPILHFLTFNAGSIVPYVIKCYGPIYITIVTQQKDNWNNVQTLKPNN